MADKMFLIVGLGNPGARYEGTRHNIGFDALDAFAKKQGMTFRLESRVKGECAKEHFEIGKVFILKPNTYMNLSGESVRKCLDYYKIPRENLLVVTDDIYIPFGKLRMRAKGSSGGHNGLENIEQHIHTNQYSRLRVGVGNPADSDMASYVLDGFRPDEKKQLKFVLEKAAEAIELWLEKGVINAMNKVNVHPKVKEKKNDKTEKEPL